MSFRNLDVLDAAERAADLVDALIERATRPRLLHARQLRHAVQSIAAKIAEGLGPDTGRDGDRPLEIARGETEEAIRYLGVNLRTNRIGPKDYWPIHNLPVGIVTMLNARLNRR